MRKGELSRNTKETQIKVYINLDGTGVSEIATGIPFLDHMLEQVARHGLIDMVVEAKGDLEVDAHHTVEDVGITLGQLLNKILGDKRGLVRYGFAYVPLDESMSRVVIDLSGRPGLFYNVSYTRSLICSIDFDLVYYFYQGFVNQ